jgi:predicted dehydrogenase
MEREVKKLRIGVFGAYRGRTMIDILSDHPEASTVAICDRSESALEESSRYETEAGIKVTYYTDVDAFFQHHMDAVVLANCAHEHAPYAIRALDSGRHMLSEVQAV